MNAITTRRDFLAHSAASAAGIALARSAVAAETSPAPAMGKAEHCIFMWLGGGAGQIDTWDPKQLGDPKAKKAGSYYRAINELRKLQKERRNAEIGSVSQKPKTAPAQQPSANLPLTPAPTTTPTPTTTPPAAPATKAPVKSPKP